MGREITTVSLPIYLQQLQETMYVFASCNFHNLRYKQTCQQLKVLTKNVSIHSVNSRALCFDSALFYSFNLFSIIT